MIDVSGKGYAAGRTSGNTTVGASTQFSGGSYGGLGAGSANAVYGDYAGPQDWGSGGGNAPGGGRVRLVATTLQLEGQLLANGSSVYNGVGSGGGVLVVVTNLAGGGSIQAQGGLSNDSYGAGGGGRVAVYAADYSGFNLAKITAFGGAVYFSPGGAGTVYLRDTDEAAGTLIIDAGSGGNGGTPLGLQGTNWTSIPDLLVVRGANTHVMLVNTASALTFTMNLSVTAGAQLITTSAVSLQAPITLSSGGSLQVAGALTSSVPLLLDGGSLTADIVRCIPRLLVDFSSRGGDHHGS